MKQLYRHLEEICQQDPGSITGHEKLADIGWDSMSSIMFIALADEQYGKQIDASVLSNATAVKDLEQLLG
jgi:acyl carrier protein